MRKILLTASTLLISSAVLLSQNVGIGTLTPSSKLDVKSTSSNVAQFNGAAPMFIALFENDIYKGYIGSYAGAVDDIDVGTGATNFTGRFHLTTQAIPRLTVDAAGLVGVGTTSPSQLLHITGGNLFVESPAGKIILGQNINGGQWRFGTSASGNDLRWYTWDGATETQRHYFTQNGNVGIATGATAPIARLDVLGAGTTSATNTFSLRNSAGDTLIRVRDDGKMGIGYNGST